MSNNTACYKGDGTQSGDLLCGLSSYLPAVMKTGTVFPMGFVRKMEAPRTLRVHVQIQVFEIARHFAIRVCGLILSVSNPRAS